MPTECAADAPAEFGGTELDGPNTVIEADQVWLFDSDGARID
jgi:uncharacterized protein YneR